MKSILIVCLMTTLPALVMGQDSPAKPKPAGVQVERAQLTLIEQAEVPAREAGVLRSVSVREGELVKEGQELGLIDDAEAQLDKRKAQLELEIARVRAQNDVKPRLFKKASEVAWAQFRRSEQANKGFGGVVSKTELEKERLEAQKADLEIEQAEHELVLEGFNVQVKENDYATALRAVERRQILAPLAGVVVQINRRPGEWVEPGEPVLRILRVDRLRVEGRVHADLATSDLTGQPVVFTPIVAGQELAPAEGKVVFVSPEVNPVNGEVQIWAEIDNPKLRLRPGLEGTLTIAPVTMDTAAKP